MQNHIHRLVGVTGAAAFAHLTYRQYVENQARL